MVKNNIVDSFDPFGNPPSLDKEAQEVEEFTGQDMQFFAQGNESKGGLKGKMSKFGRRLRADSLDLMIFSDRGTVINGADGRMVKSLTAVEAGEGEQKGGFDQERFVGTTKNIYGNGVEMFDKYSLESIGGDGLTNSERNDLIEFENALGKPEEGIVSFFKGKIRSIIGSF